MCAMSAPSKRSLSMMNAFIQIISSGAQSFTGISSSSSCRARSNHESSTSHNPFPARKIRSRTSFPYFALANQCGNVSSVSYPARANASSAPFKSFGRIYRSKSFVLRDTPAYTSTTYAPPIRNGISAARNTATDLQ